MQTCAAIFIAITMIYSNYGKILRPKYDCPRSLLGGCTGPFFYETGGVDLDKERELTLTYVQVNDISSIKFFRSYPTVIDHGQCTDDSVIYQVFSQETAIELNPKL